MRTGAAPWTVLTALATLPLAAAGQDAREILATALERYEERVEDVDEYTVIQDVDGMRVSVHFQKEMKDGHPVFHARILPGGDLQAIPGGDRQQAARSPAIFAQLEHARVIGTESVDGRPTWVLQVPDAGELGLDGAGFTPSTLTLNLDQEEYVPLRIVVEGSMESGGPGHTITMTTRLEDYREVEGLLHPFRTTVTVEGLSGGMSGADRAEMQREMQKMQEELAALPPEQRRMMEEQMKRMPQMRQMMKMMEAQAAGKDMEMTIQVQEVFVNRTPTSSR